MYRAKVRNIFEIAKHYTYYIYAYARTRAKRMALDLWRWGIGVPRLWLMAVPDVLTDVCKCHSYGA